MSTKVTQLPSGIRVVTEKLDHVKSIAIGAWFTKGSRSELEHEHGVAHMLEHMAFKGTHRRSARQIAEDIEAVGGDINASTSIECTGYYARMLEEDTELAIDILSDIIQNSLFDNNEFRREQKVIMQEIAASHDAPDDYIFDLFQQRAFHEQALGRTILGSLESVSSMRISDLKAYMHRNYTSDQLIISAAGALDHDDLANQIDLHFNNLPESSQTEDAPALYTGGDMIIKDDLEQVHCIIGFEGCNFKCEDFYAAQVLASVLGGGMSSRLFQVIREENALCYSIFAFQWSFIDAAVFGIHSATSKELLGDLIPLILDQLKVVMNDVGEEEISRVRAQIKAHALMSMESPAARSNQLARQMMIWGHPVTLEELSEKIQNVSVEDVKKVAAKIFSSRPTLTLMGEAKTDFSSEMMQAYLGQ